MIYHSMLMRTRNLFFLFSILLNVVLIFILVARVRNPIIKEISDEQNVDFAQNSTVEKSGEVIGEEIETKEEQAFVAKVIDGDTIVLENGKTLRYIGIDTPEVSQGTECFADESTEKNKELVLGKEVRLEKDVSETDRYGRLLRYVYVANTFINEILVYEGYATAATYPPDVKYSQLFKEAEKDARENSKGLWGKCEESKEGASEVPEVLKTGGEAANTSGNWNCSTNTYNCTDFTTQSEAQNVFVTCGGRTNDVHRLDSDKDGRVCESLP